jgi:hypothetical protein
MSIPVAPLTVHLVTRFINQTVALVWNRYENGRLALDFVNPVTGGTITRPTVNLPDEPLENEETFIKSYSENDGMVEALTALGLIERTGRLVQSSFVVIEVCQWRVQPAGFG